MFLLSGVAFARYQLGTVVKDGSTAAIERSVLKIAVASFPVSLVMGLHGASRGSDHWGRVIFFLGNLVDWATTPVQNGVWLWFIGCYIQIFLTLILILRIPAVRGWLREKPFPVLLAAFVLLGLTRFALPALFQPGGVEAIAPMSIWTYLPNAHAGTFLLGASVVVAGRGTARSMIAIALGIVYAAATSLFFPGNELLITATSLVLVAVVPMMPLPRIAALGTIVISRASLYIYLLHMPLHHALQIAGLDDQPLLMFIVTIVLACTFAVFFDRFYDWCTQFVRSRYPGRRLSLAEAMETSPL